MQRVLHPIKMKFTSYHVLDLTQLLRFVPSSCQKSPQFNGRHTDSPVSAAGVSDLLPPCRPPTHHVTRSLPRRSATGPRWMSGSRVLPLGAPVGVSFKSTSPLAAGEAFLSALTTSSTGASTVKSFWEHLCRSFHRLYPSLYWPSPQNIYAYTGT